MWKHNKIGTLLISEPPIQVMPALADAVGLNEAVVLQVTHCWLDPQGSPHLFEGRYWVDHLIESLDASFLFWDVRTVGYLVASLEQQGYLIVREGKAVDGSPAFYHTIDYHHLEKLVPANAESLLSPPDPEDFSEPPELSEANSNLRPPFQADIQKKGENLYVMGVTDDRHFLEADLPLEIQGRSTADGSENSAREIVCHFPVIAAGEFRQFVRRDKALSGALMIVFHLKVLDRLLAFCQTHHADRLVIFVDDTEKVDLEIYHAFQLEVSHLAGFEVEGAEVVIPANCEAIDAWQNFRDQVSLKLQQGLWQQQKTSTAIRRYLKRYGWPKI